MEAGRFRTERPLPRLGSGKGLKRGAMAGKLPTIKTESGCICKHDMMKRCKGDTRIAQNYMMAVVAHMYAHPLNLDTTFANASKTSAHGSHHVLSADCGLNAVLQSPCAWRPLHQLRSRQRLRPLHQLRSRQRAPKHQAPLRSPRHLPVLSLASCP